jgi:hypothetical protein
MNTAVKIPNETLEKLYEAVKGQLDEIALETSVSRTYVYRLLKGQRRITTKNINVIEAAQKRVGPAEKEKESAQKLADKITRKLNTQLDA